MSKNKIYKGVIVLESLNDATILKSAQMIDTVKTTLGTVYTVLISKNQIDALPEYFKDGPWYAHFWHGGEILVVFKDDTFILHPHRPEEREAAIAHGLKIGVAREALDFPID